MVKNLQQIKSLVDTSNHIPQNTMIQLQQKAI